MTTGESFNEFAVEARYFGDMRTVAMSKRFGPGAIACDLNTKAVLHQRKDHQISRAEFYLLCENHDIEDPAAFLNFLTQPHIGYLTVVDDVISSEGVNSRVQKRAEKRKKWRDSKSGHGSIPLPRGSVVEDQESGEVPPSFPTECTTPTPTPTEDLKNNGQPPVPLPGDPEEARRLEAAIEALEVPDSQPWVNSQVFIGTGRRPMRKYPTIFLTPHELAYVFELYETAGIFGQLRKTFKLCESKLSDKKGPGPPVNAYAWLTGFLYREALSAQNEAVKLKANSNRLENGIR